MGGLQVLKRTYRHVNRYREVAGILAKHGFGDLLHALGLAQHAVGAAPGADGHAAAGGACRAERLRSALQELGPTFVKAGQYLSTRADLLPPEYLRALSELQDRVPAFPAAVAREIVESELGKPLGELFASFDGHALSAASIAQAHAAVLHDGREVVVKIERPDLRHIVAVDLEIMKNIAEFAQRHSEEWRWRRPTQLVAEIARSLDREMDFSLEASHVERFSRQFAGDPTVRAPVVHRALSSTRVLTMERMFGAKADDVEALKEEGVDPRVVAARLAGHYLAMIFTHGFFHADPHPGNLLVQPDGVVAYIDFGMTGRLDRETREALADVVSSMVRRDGQAFGRALLALSDRDVEPDRRLFEDDVCELMDKYAYRPLREWKLGRMLEEFFQTTSRHRVRTPPDLFLMVKALTELESLTGALDPQFDAVAAAAPFITRVQELRMSPQRLSERLATAGREAMDLFISAPSELRELIRQTRRGRLLIEFEHKGLEPALAELDQVSNRLAYAVLLGALVIGSALIVHAGIPPHWRGVSVLGLGGFLLSGLMGLWLILAILRHGRL